MIHISFKYLMCLLKGSFLSKINPETEIHWRSHNFRSQCRRLPSGAEKNACRLFWILRIEIRSHRPLLDTIEIPLNRRSIAIKLKTETYTKVIGREKCNMEGMIKMLHCSMKLSVLNSRTWIVNKIDHNTVRDYGLFCTIKAGNGLSICLFGCCLTQIGKPNQARVLSKRNLVVNHLISKSTTICLATNKVNN